MSKKVLNISLFVIILATIAGLGYVWFHYGVKPSSQEAPKLSTASQEQIRLEGSIVSEKNADLGFALSGSIAVINKKVGDHARAGEILAVQNSDDIKAQVGVAKAQLAAARSQLDAANHDLKKEKLKIKDFSGNAKKEQKAQVSSTKDSVSAQEDAVVAAENSLAAAQATLAKTILKAPFDGIITRQDSEVGEIAGATATSFMTIASNEPLSKIEVFASDLDAPRIKIGAQAQVSFDVFGSQKVLNATVVSVDPVADVNQKSAYKVTLHLDQTDDVLKSGMHAVVTL